MKSSCSSTADVSDEQLRIWNHMFRFQMPMKNEESKQCNERENETIFIANF